MSGFFIAVEGVEGVGKSTVARFIEQFLQKHNKEVVLTREPGGTLIAESIREILLHTENEVVYPETELLLFFAARKQHVENLIIPSLKRGAWVVCDRYLDASYAYQGGGRGVDSKWLDNLVNFTRVPKPDITILLTASQENIVTRMQKRASKDRIEKEALEFFLATEQEYLKIANENPHKYHIVSTDVPLVKVQEAVSNILLGYI